MRNTVNAPSRNILFSVYRLPFITPLLGRIREYITGGTTAVYLAHSTLAKIGGRTDAVLRRVSRRMRIGASPRKLRPAATALQCGTATMRISLVLS